MNEAFIGDLLYRAYMIGDHGCRSKASMRKYPGQKPIADTSLIGAVLRRIKAVKVERGLWLKPGAKVKG